jgi:hypothetical protein
MRSKLAGSLAGLAMVALAGAAQAGVYTDDLSKCLVSSTSERDQRVFMVWMFAALSAHPDMRAYSSMTDAQRQKFSADAGALFGRLVTKDCRAETIAALKYEGNAAMEGSFTVFGQVATRGLMSNSEVEKSLSGLMAGVDMKALEALMLEAGVRPPAAK